MHVHLNSELHLAAKGKIALHGPIEIQNLSEHAKTTDLANAILISRTYEKNMLIGAGIKDSVLFDNLTYRMASLATNTETPAPFTNFFETNSKLFLIAGKIFVNSDIVPLNDGIDEAIHNIGTARSIFGTGYFSHIEVGKTETTGDNDPQKGFWLGKYVGDVEPGVEYGLIQQGFKKGDTVAQIGQRVDPIKWGFFENLQTTDLSAFSLTADKIYISSIFYNFDPSCSVERELFKWCLNNSFFNIYQKENSDLNDKWEFQKIQYAIIGKTIILNFRLTYKTLPTDNTCRLVFPYVKIWGLDGLFGENIQSDIYSSFRCYNLTYEVGTLVPTGLHEIVPEEKDYDLIVESDNDNKLTFTIQSLSVSSRDIIKGTQLHFSGTIII